MEICTDNVLYHREIAALEPVYINKNMSSSLKQIKSEIRNRPYGRIDEYVVSKYMRAYWIPLFLMVI